MKISIIIPLYNRPQEIDELLETLTRQIHKEFEVVVVEDGSSVSAESVVAKYQNILNLKYLTKKNGGPASARNFGARHASGDFFVFLDSDCIVEEDYTSVVAANHWKFWGGADKAADDFSPMQKAVNYSMTSFFTTGGIRGSKSGRLDKFFPRSFNMGVTRELFDKVGGFSDMRYGEDIDFSYKIVESGCTPHLLSGAEVCHKRRTNSCAFFRQVFASGTARIELNRRHPSTTKLVHMLPAMYVLFSVVAILFSIIFSVWGLVVLLLPALVWFIDSSLRNGLHIGLLSIWTSYIQIYGYGCGYIFKSLQVLLRK